MALQAQESEIITRQFFESQGAKIHDVFKETPYFNTSTSEYELQEVHELRETLQSVERQAPHLLNGGFNAKNCSWEQVLEQLQLAQDAANESKKCGKKFHHKIWRGMGSTAGFVIPALDAFPDNLSILHGGLAVIFTIAQKRQQDRARLLKAFGDIPRVMYMAMSKAQHFPLVDGKMDIVRLHESISYLRGTLLKVIPALIERLMPGSLRRKALSPFQGQDIDALLDLVSRAASQVQTCAEHLMDGVSVNTHNNSVEIRNIGNEILSVTKTNSFETSRGISELQEKLDEVLKLRDTLERTIGTLGTLKLERKFDAVSAANGYFQFFQEYFKAPHLDQHRDTDPTNTSVQYSSKLSQLLDKLLSKLEAHLGGVEDEYCVIRRGLSLDDAAMSQAAIMLTAREVQQLLQTPQSGIVLVDGCGDRAQMSGAISPLSVACVYLTRILRKRPRSIVLVFFCSQHLKLSDSLSGPEGILRSFISQLILILTQHDWTPHDTLSSAAPNWLGEACNRLDLRDLCQLFRWLLGFVPEWTETICVLDGVSYYEAEQWRNDYYLVLEQFDAILNDRYLHIYFKVLMSSPMKTRQLPPQIAHEHISLRNVRIGAAPSLERSIRETMGKHY
ncbi:hypothetical protein F5Y19DRAFT_408325 [Xylariaceae sp. FL1651]|nr:hypothetical protein F5Y19DRAFT_408325 [Xylariaceae sp. FL1651]